MIGVTLFALFVIGIAVVAAKAGKARVEKQRAADGGVVDSGFADGSTAGAHGGCDAGHGGDAGGCGGAH